MERKGFSKDCSFIAKGVLVMMMLLHHVFYGDILWQKEILTLGNKRLLFLWSSYGRVCLGGFAFISAYGITKQLMEVEPLSLKGVKNVCLYRLLKLESSCLFIYPLAVLYKRLVANQPVIAIYMVEGKFRPIYAFLDAVGLADFFRTPKINATWWYLSFAIFLILSLPVWYVLYKKMGWWLFFLTAILLTDKKIAIIILGIACAYGGLLEKLEEKLTASVKNWLIGLIACAFAAWGFFKAADLLGGTDYIQWGAGAVVSVISMMYFSRIPVLAPLLKLLGKHSGNIFLIHTFIYLYFYEDFIYSFRWAGLIFGILLLCSFFVSVVLEWIKKRTRYYVLIEKIGKRLCS